MSIKKLLVLSILVYLVILLGYGAYADNKAYVHVEIKAPQPRGIIQLTGYAIKDFGENPSTTTTLALIIFIISPFTSRFVKNIIKKVISCNNKI